MSSSYDSGKPMTSAMTVKDLIKLLEEHCPEDAEVVNRGGVPVRDVRIERSIQTGRVYVWLE